MAGDEGISAGTVHADVQPDLARFADRLRRGTVPPAARIGREIAARMADPIANGVARAVRDGLNKAGQAAAAQATRTARTYARTFRETLAASRPAKLPVEVDTKAVDAALKGVRERAKQAGRESGDEFGDQFSRQTRRKTDVPVGPSRQRSRKSGDDSGGGFADGFRRRVDAALKALPKVNIGVARNEAEQKLKDLRVQLEALSGKRVGVDVDAATALAEVRRIQTELDRLSRTSPDIQVRADTAAASTQLARVAGQAQAVAALRPTINVNADTGAATAQLAGIGAAAGVSAGGIHILLAAAAALAPVIVPAAAAAAAAIAAIGPAAVVGAAGIGVLALGFSGVGDAVKAMGAAERSAGKDAAQAATRQASLASASDAVANAQRSLANTRATVAESARQAASRVADAERDLARAQDDARQIQVDLTRARQEARQALEDLDSQVRNNALAQRQGNLDVAEARRELDKVLANPKASKDQIEQAKIRYEREVLQQQDLARRGKRLAAEQKAAQKAGIEGSQQVLAVRQRQAQADDRVAASARSLAEARRAQANTERQGAFQLAQAQQAVVAAQRSLAAASVTAGASGSAAMTKLREAMEGLSPAGQRFARFLHSLRPALDRIKAAAQGGLLPGVEAGIRALLPVLPQVEVFVGRVATALGGFFAAFGKAMASPFWQDFFDRMGRLAGPLFTSLATILDGLGRGFATLLLAFAPLAVQMSDGLADLAQSFADWAAEVVKSQEFKDFIAYVTANGPKLLALFAQFTMLLIRLGIAMAPFAEDLLTGLVGFLKFLNTVDMKVFVGIVYAIGALITVLTILAGGPISLVVAGLVLVVGAIVYAYTHFDRFRAVVDAVFRAAAAVVKWAWEHVIKPALTALVYWWTQVIGPAAMWLWNNVIKPVFAGIAAAVSWAWEHVIKPALAAIDWWVTNVVGPVFTWLWNNVIKPVWAAISLAIKVAWAIIRVIFGLIVIYVKAVLIPLWTFLWDVVKSVFGWIYDKAIKPAWDRIRPIFEALGGFIRDKVVPAFRKSVDAIAAAWAGIQKAASVPVKFVVEEIVNKGILATYNKLARAFGVKEVPYVTYGPKSPPTNKVTHGRLEFARGGITPGYTPGRDVHRFYSPTAGVLDLSGGEPILRPEAGRALGAGWVHGINRAARTGGIGGVRRFLSHGPIGGGPASHRHRGGYADGGVFDFITKPARYLADKMKLGMLFEKFGRNPFVGMLSGMARKVMDAAVGKAKNLFGGDDRGPVGAGPGFGSWPSSPGAQRGDSGVWRSIVALVRSSGIPYRFGNSYRHGDPLWHGSGRAVDFTGYQQDRLASFFMNMRPRVLELIHTTNQGGYYITRGRRVASMGIQDALHRDHLHVAMARGGLVPAVAAPAFDSGGYLPPGISTVVNRTGRPEPVLTDQQWQAMVAATRGGDGPREVHNWQFASTTMTPARLQAWQDRRDALNRVNRTNR